MGSMIDAVEPANIPASYDGAPALRITVLADRGGQCFDVESGNASASRVATALADRAGRGYWSVVYANRDSSAAVTAELVARRLNWTDAALWPKPGVYLWAVGPGFAFPARPSWCPVDPVAVQHFYPGPYDLSWTAPNFPVRVAGYIDGPVSAWPARAWARFSLLADKVPQVPVLNRPVIAIVPTLTGKGYWLVAQDGGVFNFGDAAPLGAGDPLPAEHLNGLIVDAAITPTGAGLWLVGSDGGVFPLGDAVLYGSVPGMGIGASPSPLSA